MVVPLNGESEHWCIVLVVVEHDGSLVLPTHGRAAARYTARAGAERSSPQWPCGSISEGAAYRK